MSKPRTLLVTVAGIVLLLIAIRVALPEALQWFVNDRLDRSEDYEGHVGDVDLNLYRGAYQIHDLEISKTDGEVPVPLFDAASVDLSILWKALFNGQVVGEITFHQPVLNIVDSEDEQNEQTGTEEDWQTVVEDLFPLRIDRITINNGELHFRNFQSEPPVDIYVSSIQGHADNLTNSEELSESLVASVEMEAQVMEDGRLALYAQLDPSVQPPAFDLNAQLLDLPVVTLDDFITAYAPFDLEAGTLDVATEMAAKDGQLEGYVKPILYDVQVFEWREDVAQDDDNIFQAAWEVLLEGVGEVFENQETDQVATNVPFSGSLENLETGVFEAVVNIFRNAFVEAFQANLEGNISLDFGGDDDASGDIQPGGEADEQAATGEPGSEEQDAEPEPADNEQATDGDAPGADEPDPEDGAAAPEDQEAGDDALESPAIGGPPEQ